MQINKISNINYINKNFRANNVSKDTASQNAILMLRDPQSSVKFEQNKEFAQKLIDEVGKRGLCDIELDLLSLDGLDDYGTVIDKVGLLTVDMYRKYNRIIEKYPVDDWWWLATPWSTLHRGYSSGVCGVRVDSAVIYGCCYYYIGVRPFCIFSSSIF